MYFYHMKKSFLSRLWKILLALLAAAIIGGGIYLNSLMCIITGYAAKNLCSAVFVSGREAADVEALDLNFSFIKFNRNKVDYENKSVSSRFLWHKSTAVYRDGYGVTLLRGKKADELRADAFPLPPEPACNPDTIDWPLGNRIEEPACPEYEAMKDALEDISIAFVDEKSYGGTPFAFLVLHKGLPVAERYGYGCNENTQLLSWSVAKSFVNAIVGIMVSDGLVDLDTPPDFAEWQGDARKDITLNNLLQMQSGLEWNENYGNRSDVNLMLHREQDMGLFALDKPLTHEPGTHWYYSSGTTNIVMRYLRSKFSSDAEFYAYIRSKLFLPLGIRNAHFETDISGVPVGSSYLYITARDFARFGQLYLSDGTFAGERILPEGWVNYTVSPASDSEGGYGAFFWLNHNDSHPDAPEDMFFCTGHDGQQIFIIPSHDLVVVILGYSPKPDGVIDFNRLLKDIITQEELIVRN